MTLHTITLTPANREEIRALYLRLDPDSTYRRFGVTLSPESVSRYVDRLDLAQQHNSLVLGAYDGDRLVGICEAVPMDAEGALLELAFAVAPGYQGKRVGYTLGGALLRSTARRLVLSCVAENAPMNRLAQGLGFRRIGRGQQDQGLPEALVEELYTPHGLYAGQGQQLLAA